jgi:LmbE family N-acetylglucosaminyl deacetylase
VTTPHQTPGGSVGDLGTILGVWAHPDDEVYLSGGVMAAARDAGRRVVCVTATRGEHGQDGPHALPPDQLGRLREQELRAALGVLGVEEHRFLGVEDGRCAEEPGGPMVQRLANLIEQVAPTTILTFGPDGMTGHQDHQVVSRWVKTARAVAAPDAELLYATSTAEHADTWRDLHDRFDLYLVPGLPLRRHADELAFELRLDARSSQRKMTALAAMPSQTGELIAALGPRTFRDWCSVESFVSADAVRFGIWPSWRPARLAARLAPPRSEAQDGP